MTDLYMRIMVSATDSASGVMRSLAGAMGSIAGGPLKQMSNGFGDLSFGLRNIGLAGTIGMDSIKMGAVQAGNALWKMASIVALVGAAVAIGIGVMAVRAAADFQQGLNRLRTGAGDTQDSFASLSKGILQVSIATGETAKSLTDAMYLILSSGQRGAQAFDTLKVAAQGAVIEQANVVDVANVVSGAMHNFGTKTYGAAQYMNGLIVAVSLGKITLQNLSTSMGPLEPLAHQLGISYNDLAAAMTTQTNAMIPAARAATSLRFMMQALEVPTKKAKDAMTAMGLDSVKVAEEMKKSLPGALQMIYNAAKKAGPEGSVPFNRAVSDMVGGQRSLSAFLALSGTHMKDFVKNSADIGAAMKKGGTDVQGWAIAQSNANVQMNRVKSAGQALLITIGQGLLPAFTNIMAAIAPIIAGFTQWVVQSHAVERVVTVVGTAFMVLGTVVGGVVHFFRDNEIAMAALQATLVLAAVVIGTVMVIALLAAAGAAWAFTIALLANPIVWIAIAIIAAIALIILAIKHWGDIMDWLTGKAEQMRIAHEQKIVAMRIAADNNTIKMAQKMIANEDVARVGILKKLQETTDPYQRRLLLHQLAVLNIQENANKIKLAMAEKDKIAQLKKQAELHAQMLEAQKWFGARFFDMVVVWTGNVFSAIGTWTHNVLSTIGQWFGNILSALGTFTHNFFSAIGTWIGNVSSAIGTFTHNVLTTILTWFGNVFSALGTFVHNFLSTIGQWKDSVILKVAQMVFDFVNWIKSIPSRLAALAGSLIAAGAQIVQNIASGIMGAIGGALGNAMGAVGNFISSHLPHSPAKVGPLKDLDKQARMISQQIAAGLIAGSPAIQAAMQRALAPVSVGIQATGREATGLTGAALPRTTTGGNTGVQSRGPVTIHAPITINAQNLDARDADRIAILIADKLRAQLSGV